MDSRQEGTNSESCGQINHVGSKEPNDETADIDQERWVALGTRLLARRHSFQHLVKMPWSVFIRPALSLAGRTKSSFSYFQTRNGTFSKSSLATPVPKSEHSYTENIPIECDSTPTPSTPPLWRDRRSGLTASTAVAITTGMRPSECIGLKWQDVDWEWATVSVKRTHATTGVW